MKKLVINSALLLVAALGLHGCFKSTVGYTYFNLAVYDQMESEDQFKPSTDIDTYAFWVDTTDWYIASWEDAVSRRITNKTTGETRKELILENHSKVLYDHSLIPAEQIRND
jgi:protease II